MSSLVRDWKTYRTRFLIKAIQLDAPFRFTDPLGREHSGQKGDYLVESADGLQRIAPREIFEDIYVPMDSSGKRSGRVHADSPAQFLHQDPSKLHSKSRSLRNSSRSSTHPPAPNANLTRRWSGKTA